MRFWLIAAFAAFAPAAFAERPPRPPPPAPKADQAALFRSAQAEQISMKIEADCRQRKLKVRRLDPVTVVCATTPSSTIEDGSRTVMRSTPDSPTRADDLIFQAVPHNGDVIVFEMTQSRVVLRVLDSAHIEANSKVPSADARYGDQLKGRVQLFLKALGGEMLDLNADASSLSAKPTD